MFFEGERITAMREMIVARDEAGRRRALAKLLPMQRADFEGIFEAMNGLPVTIRLLDPPLHEFLPHGGEEIASCLREHSDWNARSSRASSSRCAKRIRCSAIAAAGSASRFPRSPRCRAARFSRRQSARMRRGIDVRPEIMVPLVVDAAGVRESARDHRGMPPQTGAWRDGREQSTTSSVR